MPTLHDSFQFIKKWGPLGFITHYTVSISALVAIWLAVNVKKDDILGYMPDYVPRTGRILVWTGANF